MSQWGYVALGWIVTFGVVGGYALSVLARARRAARRVPAAQRRWMDAGADPTAEEGSAT